MPLKVSCPGCKANLQVPERLAGKAVKCQKCARVFKVPVPEPEATVPLIPPGTLPPPLPEHPAEQPPPPPEPILNAIVIETPKPTRDAMPVEPEDVDPPRSELSRRSSELRRPLPKARGLSRTGVLILGLLAGGFVFALLVAVAIVLFVKFSA